MYESRSDAGQRLAQALRAYRGRDVLVLALPRGGVEVGYEVAEALNAELDVLVVRKLGAPDNPELGVGAIASHGAHFIDENMIRRLNIHPGMLEEIKQREWMELERRQSAYRDALPPPHVEGRTVILVDDGIATGGTARVAIRAVRSLDPERIVLAVPVAPPETVELLGSEVDELVCLQTPSPFSAISLWYKQFRQTTDEQVVDLLRKRRAQATANR